MDGKIGRPPIDSAGPMGKVLQIRLSEAERADYMRAAKSANLKLSEWIRDRLSRAAKREQRKI